MPDSLTSLCLECGSAKEGAWKKCPDCKHIPKDNDDMAKHLILTSHFNSQEKLSEFQELIQTKKAFKFDEEHLKMVQKVVSDKNAKLKADKKWARNILVSISLFIILGILAYVYR